MIASMYFLTMDTPKSSLEVMKRMSRLGGRTIGDDTFTASVSHIMLQQGFQTYQMQPVLNEMDLSQHIKNEVHQFQSNLKKKKAASKQDYWPNHIKVQGPKDLKYNSLDVEIYNNPVRSRTDWKGESFIVYLCNKNLTCAGWGDRQHGIFSAYLLSLVTNRTLKVEMDSPCPLWKLYHPRLVNWKINGSELHGLSSTHIYALNDREFREYMKVIDFNKEFPQDVVYITTNYDYYYNLKENPNYQLTFKKQVRNRPRPILFADLWQAIFKFNKRVIRKFSKSLKIAHPTKQHKLVCAHVRFGRNPTIPTDGDVRNTLSSITPLWSYLEKYSDPSKYRLFVASDWQAFRDKVKDIYKNVTTDIDGQIVHIDKISTKSNITNAEEQCNGFEKVIADQHVLSQCDILLLTYSVFGKAAAYLRRSNNDLFLMENNTIKPLQLFNTRKYKPKH